MKIMSVDFGDARTGLAMCDRLECLASPIGVIHERNFAKAVEQIAFAAKEFEAQMVVVGNPISLSGEPSARSEKCAKIATMLQNILGIPTVLWDERRTTLEAAGILNVTNTRGQKRKDVIDEVAAVLILESYMTFRKNTGEK